MFFGFFFCFLCFLGYAPTALLLGLFTNVLCQTLCFLDPVIHFIYLFWFTVSFRWNTILNRHLRNFSRTEKKHVKTQPNYWFMRCKLKYPHFISFQIDTKLKITPPSARCMYNWCEYEKVNLLLKAIWHDVANLECCHYDTKGDTYKREVLSISVEKGIGK